MESHMIHSSYSRELDEEAIRLGPMISEHRVRAALIAFVIFLIFLLVIFGAILAFRDFLCGCFRPDDGRSNGEASQRRERTSRSSSRSLQSSQSLHRLQILEKRFERRSWYEYYLKKFVHVVAEEDIIVDDVIGDIEEGGKLISIPYGNGRKTVEGYCAICLSDYEVGDEVVRSSGDECKHVFCTECMLHWLSKGKKKCPVCRSWFVPGTRISDQIDAEFGTEESGDSTVHTENEQEGA